VLKSLGALTEGRVVHALEVKATTRRTGPKTWILSLRTFDGARRGEREVVLERCEQAAETAAVAIALAARNAEASSLARATEPSPIEAAPGGTEANRAPDLPVSPAPVVAPAPSQTVEAKSADRANSERANARVEPSEPELNTAPEFVRTTLELPSVRVSARAIAGANSGLLPGWSPQFGVGAAVHLGEVRLELRALRGVGQTLKSGPVEGSGGAFQMTLGGALLGCWSTALGRWDLGACVGAEGGSIYGRGFGLTDPTEGTAGWLTAGGGPALGFSLSRLWSIRLDGLASTPLVRPAFEIADFGVVHRTSAFVFSATVGLEVRSP
jgi:hypothetical protein